MLPSNLSSLPFEILSQIISQLYPPWSLSVLDRAQAGPLAVCGLPTITTTLSLVNHSINSLATAAERSSFSKKLIFTTSATQWRILTRLRALSPERIGWVLEHVEALTFCSPPLFTNRIPWAMLPRLRSIELDYRSRSVNFRCEGSLDELLTGVLDGLIVDFATDTARFDDAVVEDAWKTVEQSGSRVHMSIRRVEVLVTKRMQIFGTVTLSSDIRRRYIEGVKLKVTATHRGRLEEVRFAICLDGELIGDTAIWTAKGKFRDALEQAKPVGHDRRLPNWAQQSEHTVTDLDGGSDMRRVRERLAALELERRKLQQMPERFSSS